MKKLGFGAIGAGILLLLIAFGYDTAPEDTHNIGLLQEQMMLLSVACVLGLAGVIASCIAIALERMEHSGLLLPSGVKPIASKASQEGAQ